MSTHRSKFQSHSFPSPHARQASLDELQRRAKRLRSSIAHERDLKKVVDAFYDGFLNEARLYENSSRCHEPKLHAVLDGLCARFPGEVIERPLFFSEELGLFHGALCSSRRVGCVFQFQGDSQGVIALSPLALGSNTDFFRYTMILDPAMPSATNTVPCRGGSA